MADSPLYDDAMDPPDEAKKLTDVRWRERHAAGIVASWCSFIFVALFITAACGPHAPE